MSKYLNILDSRQKLPSHFKLHPLSIGVSLALAFTPLIAFAENDDATQAQRNKLQMIQVVGKATSGLDSVVTEEQLEDYQADDLSDIFSSDPAVAVGGSVGMSEKIYVRNIGEDVLSITVDGAEQANAVFHHSGRVTLEPELLKRVEVETGGGSATAGPGALGGAVKFTTKDPEDLLQPGKQIGALLKLGGSTNEDGRKASVTLFGQDDSERFGAMVSFVDSNVDDLEDGNGAIIDGSESRQDLGYVKFVADITDEQYISLSHENLREQGDILYRPDRIASVRNVAEPTRGERETTTLNYGLTSDNSDLIDVSITAYNTEYYQSREFRSTEYDGAVESNGLTVQNTSLLASQKLVYGINYRDDKSYLNDVDFLPGNTYFEENGKVKGAYVQDVITVTDQLTVSGGLRYDKYTMTDEDNLNFSESGVSRNLSANFALTPEWGISAGYANVFRGPEVEDSFRVSFATNDANLQAERGKNAELAIDYKKNGFKFSAGAFETIIENAILRTPPGSSTVTNLSDDIDTDGYFLNLSYSTNKFDISAKYLSADTTVNGEIATRYVYSSKATSIGDTLVLDLDYRVNDSWKMGWVAEYVQDINNIQQTVGGQNLTVDKPGYDVHDIYVSWKPLKDDQLTISLSVLNVFDEQYLSHASLEDYRNNAGFSAIAGSPEPGREVRLTTAWRL